MASQLDSHDHQILTGIQTLVVEVAQLPHEFWQLIVTRVDLLDALAQIPLHIRFEFREDGGHGLLLVYIVFGDKLATGEPIKVLTWIHRDVHRV